MPVSVASRIRNSSSLMTIAIAYSLAPNAPAGGRRPTALSGFTTPTCRRERLPAHYATLGLWTGDVSHLFARGYCKYGVKNVSGAQAEIRISLKRQGGPTYRVELISVPFTRRFRIRRNGTRSRKLREDTATEFADEIRRWLVPQITTEDKGRLLPSPC